MASAPRLHLAKDESEDIRLCSFEMQTERKWLARLRRSNVAC
jgi:hypothetical protein